MNKKPALNTELLRSKLKLKHLTSQTILVAHHPHAKRLLVSGVIAGSLLLTPSQILTTRAALPPGSEMVLVSSFDLRQTLSQQLGGILPEQVEPLNESQETQVSDTLHKVLGIHASPQLEGNRLNRSYGLMGAEQHLPRFPGDTADQHEQFIKSGITPGRGAWGYFANSRQDLTADLIEKEKYYVAVQTLYLPTWETQLAYLRDWYKYRKMIAVNPKNGRAIVVVVADSGPAAWTGKHFGGSPEVMAYLGLNVGMQKGAVVLFFVDDAGNQVPLGPLEQNLEKPALLSNI